MFRVFILSVCCLFLTSSTAWATTDTVQDPVTHVDFPKKISFEADHKTYHLDITGEATRTKFLVKVYSMAHYLQDPVPGNEDSIYHQILDDSKAKQMTIQWLLDIDAGRLKEGFDDSFHKVLKPEEYSQYKKEIDQYLGFILDIKKNGQQILRWIPGGTLAFEWNGELRGTISNPAFTKVVWGMWFSPESPINRSKLVDLVVK
jgi:hypothetical protein